MERRAPLPRERPERVPRFRKAGSAHAPPPQGHALIPRHRRIIPRPSLPTPPIESRAISNYHSSHSVLNSSTQPTRKESAASPVLNKEWLLNGAKLVCDRSHRIKGNWPGRHPRSNALVEKDRTHRLS